MCRLFVGDAGWRHDGICTNTDAYSWKKKNTKFCNAVKHSDRTFPDQNSGDFLQCFGERIQYLQIPFL